MGPLTERCREKAREILSSDQGAEVDEGMAENSSVHVRIVMFSTAEKEYLLEYYSLVREGKTNYVSNLPMLVYFGTRGQEPTDFFKTYSVRLLFPLTCPWLCTLIGRRRSSSPRNAR